eukprot:Hpha_TRINITY_DN30014_c0_g1::TRINITY_DN30014_c0_g1_i1::g.21547::m.21547
MGCGVSRVPSSEELAVLQNAVRLVNTPVDEQKHEPELRALWEAMRANDPPPPESAEEEFSLESYEWKRFGFQAPKPVTDFRGGGLLSLRVMLACVRRRPRTMGHISRSQRELRRGSDYVFGFPVAAAMINVTRATLQVCKMQREGGLPVDLASSRSPLWPLVTVDGGFEGIFAALLERMAAEVLSKKVKYAEFNSVLNKVRQEAEGILRTPLTLPQLREKLGLGPDEADLEGGMSLDPMSV